MAFHVIKRLAIRKHTAYCKNQLTVQSSVQDMHRLPS